MDPSFIHKIFEIQSEKEFEKIALEVFKFQAKESLVYSKYIELLGIDPTSIQNLDQIPFLPIDLFKGHKVFSGNKESQVVFESSGTTGSVVSKHYVADADIYIQSLEKCFNLFYGSPENYCILALLPSYLERANSSLVFMAGQLIGQSKFESSGFYLYNYDALKEALLSSEKNKTPTLLLGVSFALVEFAGLHPMPLQHTIIMETGGMKGRGEEVTRDELHSLLQDRFNLPEIHSEYGMTELLSQAYSTGKGIYKTPPWMKILIRDLFDPLSRAEDNKSGGIDIIDLANVWSCSFISTQDIGKIVPEGGFEVLGRFDHSDLRGCNMMIE
jgi:hypothetical protein